jgi:hypothetical protein
MAASAPPLPLRDFGPSAGRAAATTGRAGDRTGWDGLSLSAADMPIAGALRQPQHPWRSYRSSGNHSDYDEPVPVPSSGESAEEEEEWVREGWGGRHEVGRSASATSLTPPLRFTSPQRSSCQQEEEGCITKTGVRGHEPQQKAGRRATDGWWTEEGYDAWVRAAGPW